MRGITSNTHAPHGVISEGGFTVSIRKLGIGGLTLALAIVLLGVLALPALAAAPETPETVAASGVTATTATLNGALNPGAAGEAGTYEFLYKPSVGECTEGSTAPTPAGIALGVEKEHVSVAVSGLLPGTQYTFCLLARNAAEETTLGQPLTFTTPAVAPVVASDFATEATADSATLGAEIDPGGAATTYHFEYGTTAAYGESTTESASVGSDDTEHGASAHIQGLAAETTYHYRVVATSAVAPGGVPGPDHTFTTQPSSAPFVLPDGRAYEMVTPVEKGDGLLPPSGLTFVLLGAFQSSTNGDKFAYSSQTPFSGAQAGAPNSYLATRGPSGWASQDLTPPQAPTKFITQYPKIVGYSADLSKATFADGENENGGSGLTDGEDSPPLVSGEPPHNLNLFLRDNETGSYRLMDVTPPGTLPGETSPEGASADYSHVFFRTMAQLTPGALGGTGNLYQWAGGVVSLVGQIPVAPATSCGIGGSPCIAAPAGASLGVSTNGHGYEHINAVSPDGSKVFFRDSVAIVEGQLYMRENGTTTVEISASQKTNGSGPGGTDPNGRRFPRYWPASADGSKAFFTSCEQLTNDSTADSAPDGHEICVGGEDDRPIGNDLYQYDTVSGVLSDLTVDRNGDPFGADVLGVLGASADGSYVYFVANGVLASGARLGNCDYGNGAETPGQACNLYVAHDGVTTFIAQLDWSDRSDWDGEFTARVTPDGLHMAFESVRSLTGYDNTIADGASTCDRKIADEEPMGSDPRCSEVYLYDAVSGQLACASCNPSGTRPIGPSRLDAESEEAEVFPFEYLPRNLSEDGTRVFFESVDALVPGDVNGKWDVYEYEGGGARLISDGTSSSDSTFLDAGPSGDDVFFDTRAQLVPQDIDQKLDIYDARVGGGFAPTASPLSCEGEACKAPPSGQAVEQAPGSSGVFGVGNLAPSVISAPVVKNRSLTRTQKLAAALRVCRREPRRRRASCVAHAQRLYGPAKAAGKTGRRSGKGTK